VACIATACVREEEYGFIARLGNDTTSVEHVRRTDNRIMSDVVERSPRVVRKQWQASFDGAGKLRDWTMTKRIMNPAPGESAMMIYRMDYHADSVVVTEENGSSTRRYLVSDVLPVTVPWEAYVYGLYELLFERALSQNTDSVAVRQYIPGRGLLRGVVRKRSPDSLTFVTGGLAGTGSARFDADHRMSAYSGRFTTYKQEVQRVSDVPDIDSIAAQFAAVERRAPIRSMSARDTSVYRIGGARLTIDYSRPLRRGRTILGDVVPYGTVWRTGANAATQLSTDTDIVIGGIAVPRGTYTLWTLPERSTVHLIINRQHGQWGTRYNSQLDVGRAQLRAEALSSPIDTFTIRLDSAAFLIEWDHFRWNAPVVVR
jgi:hypothetical protein